MAITVEFTRNAILDVKEIVAHLKEITSVEKARKVRKDIFDATKRLKNHPQLGKLDEKRKNKDAEVRYLIHSPYRIYYELTTSKIFIIEVSNSRKP